MKKRKKLISLIMSFVFFAGFLFSQQSYLIKAEDYSRYSNAKRSWWLKRNTEHKQVTADNTSERLAKYNAYYLNDQVDDKHKVFYLTFDCGYENGYTAKILDTLAKHKAKAAFFVTKAFIESNKELCIRMKKEGHIVGNHTMNHPSLPDKSIETITNEIKGCASLFKKQTGYSMNTFIRPPMGEYSYRTLKVTKDLGYKTIFWSMAYLDYDVNKQPGKEYVINHFKQYHHNGAIPLIHNISSSDTEALDEVLTYLEGQGYRFGSLKELGIRKDKAYSTGKEVALYLKIFGKLPTNYITRDEAIKAGWDEEENLWEVTDKKSIGRENYANTEKKLPVKEGRVWYSCDVNYQGGMRGTNRIVYSNDGLIYYTKYGKNFIQVY